MRPEAEGDGAALATLASDCAALGIRRRIVLLRLPPSLRRPSRGAARRGMQELMAPLASADRGQMFLLPGYHLAAAWRENPRDSQGAARQTIETLREALAACPDGAEGEILILGLPEEAAQVQAFLSGLDLPLPAPPQAAGETLDQAELVALEAALAHADLARFVRRSTVWRLAEDGLSLAWEHRRLDLDDLAASLSPGRDLAAEPWLYARLARTLDRRMLALLADPLEVRGASPFAIDLSPASILDAAFTKFDRALPRDLRGRVVLRLPPAELGLAPDQLAPALRAAQGRGYRTMVAAPDAVAAALFPRGRTGAELAEIPWPATTPPAPPDRVVLTGVSGRAALDWAAEHGIGYVTGPAADQMARTR